MIAFTLSKLRGSVTGGALIALIWLGGSLRAAENQPPVRARNVILIIGDAGGIPTLHAGSLYHHSRPNGLYIQSLPYIGLLDTSAADAWVTDSAAGITAIVTGQKTNNGVLSEAPNAVRGSEEGTVLKTVLEYAEEHGLSSGVITNVAATDATAAGCYAHVSDRGDTPEIIRQFLAPRFGNGVDVLIGAGRDGVVVAADKLDIDFKAELQKRGYGYYRKPEDALASRGRMVALFDTMDFDLPPLVYRTIETLSQNPKGYFLLAECDVHTDRLKLGLEHVGVLDQIVREAVRRAGPDTLVIFCADHSFDVRLVGGKPGQPLLDGDRPAMAGGRSSKPVISVGSGHSGEQVLVAAVGPGAERIHGFMTNTDLFGVMLAAYGWTAGGTKREVSQR